MQDGHAQPCLDLGSSAGFLRESVCHSHSVSANTSSVTGEATQPLHKSWLRCGQPELQVELGGSSPTLD